MDDYWDVLWGAKTSEILRGVSEIPVHDEKINSIIFYKKEIKKSIDNLEQNPSLSEMRENTIQYRNMLEKIWDEKENKCTCSESVACIFCMER